MSENLKRSEIVIASILQKLLEQGLSESRPLKFSDFNLPADYEPFFGTSARWLVAEGIIRVQGITELMDRSSHVVGSTLTSKGFALLGQKFLVSGTEVSAAEIVSDRARGQAKYSTLGDFLGGILGGFSKSISS